ncbi:glycosyl hydrolase family 28-related protein [uncultured Paludibaculum sp.]|uniref:glycosyl hydrolase family 28-related protein n=1 Tax=uncultured Paludibaculum sp. TaxID=1765020 RepID=UPI002AAAA581|nr:glycosyl hydrolase family 28-related protein [uncultured Paludibaculum sp.]
MNGRIARDLHRRAEVSVVTAVVVLDCITWFALPLSSLNPRQGARRTMGPVLLSVLCLMGCFASTVVGQSDTLPSGTGNLQPSAESKTSSDRSVNVRAFGAKGDWTGVSGTDDTAAFESAFSTSRRIYIPPGVYVVSKPIILLSGQVVVGAGRSQTKIVNRTSDVFQLRGNVNGIQLQDFSVAAYAGHVLNVGEFGLSLSVLSDIQWSVIGAPDKAVMYVSRGGGLIDVNVSDFDFGYPAQSRTVGAVYSSGDGHGFRLHHGRISQIPHPGDAGPYAIEIDAGRESPITGTQIDHVTFEQATGGAVKLSGNIQFSVSYCNIADMRRGSAIRPMFNIGKIGNIASAYGRVDHIWSMVGTDKAPDIAISDSTGIELEFLDANYIDGGGEGGRKGGRVSWINDISAPSAGRKVFQNIDPGALMIVDGEIRQATGIPRLVLRGDGGPSSYSSTTEVTMRSVAIPVGAVTVGSVVRIRAFGSVKGRSGGKTVMLRFGEAAAKTAILAKVGEGAADENSWMIEGEIQLRPSVREQQSWSVSWNGSRPEVGSAGTTAYDCASHPLQIAITSVVSNAKDSIELRVFEVEVLR